MKRISETQHDQMVRYVYDYLINNGYREVKADIGGFSQPDLIFWESSRQGHIPDVTAKNGNLYVFEVETADSINDNHTQDQWTLFSAFAKQHGATFWVVVPNGYESTAKSRLTQLGIQGKVWTV